MVEELNLTRMIAQAALAMDAVEVFLGALSSELWLMVYLRQRHGKISRTICDGLAMSVFLMYTARNHATVGVVDYTNYDDMKYAIRKLDDTEFRNAFSRAYIRVRQYDARSRSRSRSLSYSRSRSYSRSVSRSPLPVDERSPSRSRSPVSSVSGKSVSRSPRSRSLSRSASPARSD
uniref:Uncharacterized protein n=1 Tax=Aegilops tauschii subsp. strangulata TaxID=200361 RepID=A0A453FBN2_AEGTS